MCSWENRDHISPGLVHITLFLPLQTPPLPWGFLEEEVRCHLFLWRFCWTLQWAPEEMLPHLAFDLFLHLVYPMGLLIVCFLYPDRMPESSLQTPVYQLFLKSKIPTSQWYSVAVLVVGNSDAKPECLKCPSTFPSSNPWSFLTDYVIWFQKNPRLEGKKVPTALHFS